MVAHSGQEAGQGFIDRVSYVTDALINEVSCTTLPIKGEEHTVFKIAVENPHPEKEVKDIRICKADDAGEGEIILVSFESVNPNK